MNQISDIDKRLINYLYDDMDTQELVGFEKEMMESPDISESYRMNLRVKEYLKAKVQLEEMKSDPLLEEAERLAGLAFIEEPPPEENIREEDTTTWIEKKKFPYFTAIAAAISLLVVVRFFVPFSDPDRLFLSYYEPMDAATYTQRGDANETDQNLSEGIHRYIQGDYEQSGLLLDQLDTRAGAYPEVQFFRGLNRMGLEQYSMAGEILENYIDSHTRFIPEATWYLLLCYLKTGDVEKARDRLEQLQNYNGMYRKDAQILERKLRRME